MLAERALVRKAAFLHDMGRSEVQLVTFSVHPVKGEPFKPECKERPEDLRRISVFPEFRQQDTANFRGAWLSRINFEHHKAGKCPGPRYPDCKHIIHPAINPLRFIDRMLQEHGNLLIVLQPDKYVLHDTGVPGNAPDSGKVLHPDIFKEQSFCRDAETHTFPCGLPVWNYSFQRD
jgi:hypothetical protein